MDERAEEPLINVQHVFQLSSYGVKQEQVTFPRVTMSSHRWICCRHTSRKRKKVDCITAINLTRKTPRSLTWPCVADSAMMNPRKPWLALKVGRHFQVFNIVAEKQLHRCTTKDDVQYWTWISDDIIGMVGAKAVYHWDLSPPADLGPQKVFIRHGRLSFCQIIGYKADPTQRWLALVGLFREFDNESDNLSCVSGLTQVYSVDHKYSQPIDAQAIAFATYRRSENILPSSFLCLANRSPAQQGKLHIIELGPHKPGNTALISCTEQLFFDESDNCDFPVSVQICSNYGLVYVLTKLGHVKVCDIETGTHLSSASVSPLTLFTGAPDSEGKRALTVDRAGKFSAVGVHERAFIEYTRTQLKRPAIARRLEKCMFPE
ncbi:clathrin heavy chain-like [Patiria miniata]|uniref:Clathrin heavy chain n=1 Tax=Patiria miniata TaxID=46514 RepID=A0A914A5S4_PATMI|nr:clathrin heavy chain-like [Patiria miniata]